MVNYSWIVDDFAVAETLELNFYAFDKKNYSQIFLQTLKIDDIRLLYNHLNEISVIREGASHSGKFVETSENLLKILDWLNSVSSEFLVNVLKKISEKDKLSVLLDVLTEVDVQHLSAAHKQKCYLQEIENLENLLLLEEQWSITTTIYDYPLLLSYKAGQPEKIFQNWLDNNLWVFGVDYIKKYDFRKIAIFSEADILLESMDGFLDLIELKRPNISGLGKRMFKYDVSHKSYYPSGELSEVIWQCLFYLQKMTDYKTVLEKEYKAKILYPRIKILIWRTSDFNEEEFIALKMLNSHLNWIQIISYDYLLSCGRKILAHFWNEINT